MSKTIAKRVLKMPSVEENRKIVTGAKADPGAQPLTKAQLEAMVPLKSLRGRPKSANPKQLVSVRYSPEVQAYFKGTGESWQARMDGVLREYIGKQGGRRQRKTS